MAFDPISYKKAQEARELIQQILDGELDLGVARTEIDRILGELEEDYAPELNDVKNELNSVNQQLAQNKERLDDNSISPENFKGNAQEKLQQSLDYALINEVGIKLAKMYDITGLGPVFLNKLSSTDRTPIYIYGDGGGVIKKDSGPIWSAPTTNVGDMYFSNLKYESVSGAGVIVYDFSKLIRVNSTGCTYRDVDHVGYVDDEREFWQSVRLKNESIVGGSGDAFSYIGAYDVTFDDLLIEHRENGIKQRHLSDSTFTSNYNVRINNCVMEGLKGVAVELRNSQSLKIDGNYFEKNIGGHIRFVGDNPFLASVNISNNRSFGGEFNGELDDNPLIRWAGETRNCVSSNNFAQNAPVHDVSEVNTSRYIESNNDYSDYHDILGDNLNAIVLKTTDAIKMNTTINNNTVSHLGLFKRIIGRTSRIQMMAGEKRFVEVEMGTDVARDDLISIQTFVVNNHFVNVSYTQANGSKVRIFIENIEESDVTIDSIRVAILKPHVSVWG